MKKRYDIEKITDIFAIPEDRFDAFLVDFKSYYHFGVHLAELIDEVSKVGGIETQTVPKKMTWIDDGKHDATIRLSVEPKDKS